MNSLIRMWLSLKISLEGIFKDVLEGMFKGIFKGIHVVCCVEQCAVVVLCWE